MSLAKKAAELDAQDPLGGLRERFLPTTEPVHAYLDGNSLGRPLRRSQEDLASFVGGEWADRLIRGWTDGWMAWPERIGDELGAAMLGATAGQTVVADSTSVLLYKLARAAVDLDPTRTEIVVDTDNFPTDRYIAEGIAAERAMTLRWIHSDPDSGVMAEQVADLLSDRTSLVLLSHVAYRSGYLADMQAITRLVHEAGALMLWDLSHSVGVIPVELDACGVDLAVGCTYKYVNGGPGAPAFAYVRSGLQDRITQPIWGWLGRTDSFEMEQGYVPAAGIRRIISGTPPIVSMIPVRAGIELIAEAGIDAIRGKSIALTEFAIEVLDSWPSELGVRLATPRDPARRGGHITVCRPDFRTVNEQLWGAGVIPDFRAPDGIRIGLSPLSTTFAETLTGLETLRSTAENR